MGQEVRSRRVCRSTPAFVRAGSSKSMQFCKGQECSFGVVRKGKPKVAGSRPQR